MPLRPDPSPARPAASPPKPPTPPRTRLARGLLLGLAGLSLILAALGVVLPGLPTTPFVLLAAWAAARSSPRLHAWLLAHRLFGPMLRNWEDGGCVSRRAKWSASAAMALGAGVLLWAAPRLWMAAAGIACMAVVLTWLWWRPEPAR